MRKRISVAGIVLTVLLHSLLLFSFVNFIHTDGPPQTEGDAGGNPLQVKLIPFEEPSITAESLEGNMDAIAYPTDSRICNEKDKAYKGIGVIWMPGSGMVVHAPEFYPAYKAGVRIGDLVVGPFEETNGYIDFAVMRGHNRLLFHVKTDNICFQEG